MEFEWSKEKETLFSFETDILVSASAGTGKTTALVELYLRLLEGKTSLKTSGEISPANILAITFTKLAAEQMKEKIAEAISKRIKGMSPSAASALLRESHINTFHGFCNGLLKEYAYEAGLSPDFSIIDTFEDKLLLNESIQTLIFSDLRKDAKDVHLLLQTRRLGELTKDLKNLIIAAKSRELPIIEQETGTEGFLTDIEAAYREYDALLDRARQSGGPKGLTTKAIEHLEMLASLRPQRPDPTGDPEKVFAFFERWKKTTNSNSRWPKAIADIRKDMIAAMNLVVGIFVQMLSLPQQAALARMGERARQIYSDKKSSIGSINYDDLECKTIDLLKGHPEIRDELLIRFHAILVDEAQDTDSRQMRLLWDFLRRNHDEARRLDLPEARFLVVGDRKQSIYNFRGADVRVFNAFEKTITENGGQRLYFKENFRSSGNLLDVFNGLFSKVMKSDELNDSGINYHEGDDLTPGKKAIGSSNNPPLQFLLFEKSANEKRCRARESRALVNRLIEIMGKDSAVRVRESDGTLRRPGWGDVAILLKQMTHAPAYEKALREAGIPYTITKSKGFFDRQEIRDLIALLRFILQPFDPVARLTVLRSPAVLLSDTSLVFLSREPVERFAGNEFAQHAWRDLLERWPGDKAERSRMIRFIRLIGELRSRLPYLSPSELFEELLLRFDLATIAGLSTDSARSRGNQEKLLSMLRGWERNTPGFGIESALAKLIQLSDQEPNEAESPLQEGGDKLQVMTIHASKGLEFPIVALANMSKGSSVAGARTRLFLNEDKSIGFKLKDINGNKFDTPDFTQANLEKKKKESEEYQRLLYVALTRAKDLLILSGDQLKKDKGYWSDWVLAYLEDMGMKSSISLIRSEDEINVIKAEGISIAKDKHISAADLADSTHLKTESKVLGTFSVTMLADLLYCPRRFHIRRRLDRSTLLWSDTDDSDLPPEAMEQSFSALAPQWRGLLAHKYLEYEDGNANLRSWKTFISQLGFNEKDPEALKLGKAIETAGAFPGSPRMESSLLKRELPFLASLDLPSGSIIRLKGRIDAARLYPDGGFDLADYKLGVKSAEKLAIHELQILLYAAVLKTGHGRGRQTENRAALAYFAESSPWHFVDVSDRNIAKCLSDLEARIIESLETEFTMLDNPSEKQMKSCTDCRYAELCIPDYKD